MNPPFKIDLQESFPNLSKAPIEEAIIEVRSLAITDWQEESVSKQIKQLLPEYPSTQSLRSFQHELKVDSDTPIAQKFQDLGWRGLRCESEDKHLVAQFYRDIFIFSCLRPYENWETFYSEAIRVWSIYSSISQATEIQRLGLRFLNRIEAPQSAFELGDFLTVPPSPPEAMDLPLSGFLHHNTYQVPGCSYGINTATTIQVDEKAWLILDIDVFTTEPFESVKGEIEKFLPEMRWLKNKMFFNSITEKLLEELK